MWDQPEITPVEKRYVGILTLELLEERLGPLQGGIYSTQSLDLSHSRLRELNTLLGNRVFPSLRELILDHVPLAEEGLTTMGPLPGLLVLRCSSSKLDIEKGLPQCEKQLSLMQTFNQLRVCVLNNNGPWLTLLPFQNLPLGNLRILHCIGNGIQRIEGIGHCAMLRELVLDKNRIRFIEEASFAGLKRLRTLRMEECGMRSLAAFEHLPRDHEGLNCLCLASNRVQDIVEINVLRGLPLRSVDFTGNPLTKRPWYRPSILTNVSPDVEVIDEKEVSKEEREQAENVSTYGPIGNFGPCIMGTPPVGSDLGEKGVGLVAIDRRDSRPPNSRIFSMRSGVEIREGIPTTNQFGVPASSLRPIRVARPAGTPGPRVSSITPRQIVNPNARIVHPSLRSNSLPSKRFL